MDGCVLEDLRVALTGTNSCPILISGTDRLVGEAVGDELAEKLAAMLPKQIQPMSSTFTPPGYRRRVIANLVRSLFRRLTDAA
jgi:CO/xanthine dehydrogenase FAD-binding subunit